MTRASLRSCSICSVPSLAKMDTRDAHSLVRVPCKTNTSLYQEWTPLSASPEGPPFRAGAGKALPEKGSMNSS